ncbi:S49 family peptidase [Flagellatimonas centrodinii]|uniref:S49 family peptidase n=1 Tax=Flagellatimonas centrodinii TaxID=2806210 RepID=UPI001FEE5F71|nr:S49 family peptidase [Flagellatimonas centrodinii]ULQ45964.1 S49 family peptidase [Flagellatimonas centrodinii]
MRERMNYPMIAARVFNTPLLIAQAKADIILSVLSERLGFEAAAPQEPVETQTPDAAAATFRSAGFSYSDRGYYLRDGIAAIPVIGTLVQRGGYLGYSGMTSYDAVESMFNAALASSEVEQILFEVDSPGGEVAGAFDLAALIHSARNTKPITAIASEMAASAAYLLGSAAGSMWVARSGYTGSIGVVTAHLDVSEEMEKRGRAVTWIYAGKHKVDGHPYAALPKAVRDDIQADIDRLYGMFTSAVATHRGMSEAAVRATEARVFLGQLGVDAGLADRVGSFNECVEHLLSQSTRFGGRSFRLASHSQSEKTTMSEKENGAATITAQQLETAKAEAKAEGVKAGAAAERTRIAGILNHANAEGRADMAKHLAFETDQTVEAASALLAVSPKAAATAAAPADPLAAAMERTGTPAVGDGGADAAAAAAATQGGGAVINASDIFAKRAATFRGGQSA